MTTSEKEAQLNRITAAIASIMTASEAVVTAPRTVDRSIAVGELSRQLAALGSELAGGDAYGFERSAVLRSVSEAMVRHAGEGWRPTDPREHPTVEAKLDRETMIGIEEQLRAAFGSEQADLADTISMLLQHGLQRGDLTRERARQFGERLTFVLNEPFRSRAKRVGEQIRRANEKMTRFGHEIVDMTYSLRPDSDTPPTIDVVKPRGELPVYSVPDAVMHAIEHMVEPDAPERLGVHDSIEVEQPPRLAGAAVEGLAILSGNSPENAAQLRDQHNAGADMRPWVTPKRDPDAPQRVQPTVTTRATEPLLVGTIRRENRIAERTRRLAAAMLERWRDNTPGEQTVDQLESRTYDALVALVHSIACELEP